MDKYTEAYNFIEDTYSQLTGKVNEIFEFLTDFNIVYEKEIKKLPYHINLIDELHANENAHSRILAKLLQAKDSDNYYILKSFYEYLGSPFAELSSKSDIKITTGKDYIDIKIIDVNYTIIIENKIHNANDQETQIERYIEDEKKYGFSEKSIYVLYVTLRGGSPDEISITKKRIEELGNNYNEINYKHNVLPWLCEILKNKENGIFYGNILESALIQYIDHLKGMFKLRDYQKNMEKELEKIISNELKLNDCYCENYNKIKDKRDTFDKISSILKKMEEKAKIQYIYSEWSKYIKIKPDFFDSENAIFGIELVFNNTKFKSLIGIEELRVYYSCRKVNDEYSEDIYNFLKELFKNIKIQFNNGNKNNLDYCEFFFKSDSNQTILECFEKYTNMIIAELQARDLSSNFTTK